MFQIDGKRMKTWNVVHGCHFNCKYCSVRLLVENRLRNTPKYANGMKPGFSEREMRKAFHPGEWVFIGYMGDIACQPEANILRVIERIRTRPKVNFYMQSKNPQMFVNLIEKHGRQVFPQNCWLGTTLETTCRVPFSKVPAPIQRFEAMATLRLKYGRDLMVSIEPIMDFSPTVFAFWLATIEPDYIFIGADNYHNHLPEPPRAKLREFIDLLQHDHLNVILKAGLERLLDAKPNP
ncbi:MAG: DUF5131 family protein [Dehalogenimonas sp.]